MKLDVKIWVDEWFKEHARASYAYTIEESDANYFEKGWIDSFLFMKLISELEAAFSITFKNEEFQDRRFSTISGLIEVVEKKVYAS